MVVEIESLTRCLPPRSFLFFLVVAFLLSGLIISIIQAVFSALFFFAAVPIFNGWLMVNITRLARGGCAQADGH